jgi:hypothetical protein
MSWEWASGVVFKCTPICANFADHGRAANPAMTGISRYQNDG